MNRRRVSRLANWILMVILVMYFAALLRDIAVDQHKYQWDFKTYYYAGAAYAQGLDPYYLRSLTAAAGRGIGFPFAYSPLTLPLAQWLTRLDFKTAYLLFLALKAATVVFLVAFWKTQFLKREGSSSFFMFFCLAGFGGALYIDLIAGNISIFEQAGLWIALYAFLRNKLLTFSVLLVIVSLLKILPIAFVVVLFLSRSRWKHYYLLGSVAAFGAIQLLTWRLWPDLFKSFLSVGTKLDSRGAVNPATLALFRDTSDWIAEFWIQPPAWAATLLYFLVAGLLLLLAALVIRRAYEKQVPDELIVFFMCLTFVVAAPRMKDYSYIVILLPTFSLLSRLAREPILNLTIVIPLLSRRLPIPFDSLQPAGRIFWNYFPLLTALMVWALAAVYLSAGGERKTIDDQAAGQRPVRR